MTDIQKRYDHDRSIWEHCATTYERQIVHGHPDVTAYESFEHSFIDRLTIFLARDCGLQLSCYDFGCGSGRIHTLLAPQLFPVTPSDSTEKKPLNPPGKVVHIGGIDFSEQMIKLAEQNLIIAGLQKLCPQYLSFDIGSAFDVPAYTGEYIPFAVSVCNSIGVMQGSEGARSLFKAMHRYVQQKKGIAIISCYCKEAVSDFALGNYESTMDVCGQPIWLTPDTYASPKNTLIPSYYKRAYDPDPSITVDIIDSNKKYLQKNFKLTRDPELTEKVITTGRITTHSGYTSHWYSTEQIKEWMKEFWSDGAVWHIPGTSLDRLRGVPAQLAIVDYTGYFESIARTWNLIALND
jgi:SAM-dependent methyltransferase